jgi:hypothetical protein
MKVISEWGVHEHLRWVALQPRPCVDCSKPVGCTFTKGVRKGTTQWRVIVEVGGGRRLDRKGRESGAVPRLKRCAACAYEKFMAEPGGKVTLQ